MSKGIFVTFEGGEGCGKTTHTDLFKQHLNDIGLEYIAVREPGGTPVSEAIRTIVKEPRYEDKSIITELLLFEAARAEIVEKVIKPALEAGKVVVSDRFFDSTVAYQAFGRGMDRDTVESLNRIATGGLEPDMTFFLALDQDTAFERKGGRDLNDTMERTGRSFHERVQQGFHTIAKENPDRVVTIDAGRSIDQVFDNICEEFDRRFSKKDKEDAHGPSNGLSA